MNRSVVAAAALVLLLWMGLLCALWKPGWRALSFDDFMRVGLGQQWAARPFLATGDLVWLPLQPWIYGIGFALTRDRFSDNPMLLAALINAVANAAAAVLVGRAAWLLFGSAVGGLLAFVAVLCAPWVVFTSLSGLSEPLYYLAVATVIWALAARQAGGGVGTIALGSLGVGMAAAVRYEGWLLAPAWLAIVGVTLVPSKWARPLCVGRAWWRGRTVLVVAAASFLVPAGWMVLNAVRRGSALAFRQTTAAWSSNGVELSANVVDRLAYYPRGLLGSAPLLVPLVVILAIVGARHAPRGRLVTALVTLHFGLFCLTSLQSGVGLFTERFMFAFVLALAPLLGMVPSLLQHVRLARARAALIALLVALLLAETTRGLTHPPDEWTPPPDLLAASTFLGEVARTRSTPLRVLYGEGFENEIVVLQVQNGRRVALAPAPPDHASHMPPAADVWIEKLPARIHALPLQPSAVIGRYHLYGAVTPPEGDTLGEWSRVDENGVATTVRPSRIVGLELTSDNPPPGAEAFVGRRVPRRNRPQQGSLALRWMYGHGGNFGRIAAEVRVDGRAIFRTDLGAPSRWTIVDFEIPAGIGSSTVTVAVRTTDRLRFESTWSWGRNSTVVVKDFVIAAG